MIEYILGGVFLTGAGLAVTKYLWDMRYAKKLDEAFEKNKELFNSFTPGVMDKLVKSLDETLSPKKDLSSKLDSNC